MTKPSTPEQASAPPKKRTRNHKSSGTTLTSAERVALGQAPISTWAPKATRLKFDALRKRLGLTAAEMILRGLEAVERELSTTK